MDEHNKSLVDYVVRVENMEEDLKYVGSKVNIKLKELNLNSSSHKKYNHYYDSETKQAVAELFDYDIRCGNYTFEDKNTVETPLSL